MKTVKILKNVFHRFSCWLNRNLGPDRLTVQPRMINADFSVNERLNHLKKIYRFSQKSNIAVTGGKAAGKKSFVNTTPGLGR